MYKDVSEELVVNVIKSQNDMIAKIHRELIKIFTTTDTSDFISAATFHSELHEATSKTNARHDLHDVYEQYRKINYIIRDCLMHCNTSSICYLLLSS